MTNSPTFAETKQQKVRADIILKRLAKRHTMKGSGITDIFLTEVKNGKTWDNQEPLRMDGLAIRKSWANPCFTGYEVKVDRGDFLRDRKWPGYLNYCNEFYFVCPKDLIQPEELPKDVGLIWYNSEKDSLRTVRKAVYRQVEKSYDMLMYLVMSRLGSDNSHPFFSTKREMLEAWLEDKVGRKKLGIDIGKKAFQTISEQAKEIDSLKGQMQITDRDRESLEHVKQLAKAYGWRGWQGDLAEFLEESLQGGLPKGYEAYVCQIEQAARQLRATIPGKEKEIS